ncbi:LysM peptidoglycan-binding domain-containing protein [Mycobacterium ostraviense]|uniref:LysM domain-containing protein n=1 Tax=Mycobacterium ostraviense TaxID=2738409 RepID=A0A163ZGU2_9MYCO|nr:LysM peptidoglycan-binding domain-containing protein [Mycobacterium ostraviense]KZS61519.1 hypothetical protein A4G28_23240 [Mycobacterium ostraviense]UGT89700.1 LysM peptidoglycan-binding domain-containing protein [Mycobacterium ostraviense]
MTLMQAFPTRTRGVPLPVNRPVNRPVYRPLREPLGAQGGTAPRRPAPCRPGGAPLRYQGTGLATSAAPHRRRPVSVATTVGLAVLAGMITLWLGLMAHFGELVNSNSADSSAGVPDRLAVVRVAAGESLQDVAARVAPDTPVRQVVERIRELNDLDSSMPVAGQTLIAPIG